MKKKLRTGFTTGTAAAAATKGALQFLVEGREPASVTIRLLTGDDIVIPIHRCRVRGTDRIECSVIKDAGDDPDVTHNAEIGATVTLNKRNLGSGAATGPQIEIRGGEGVGRVTKPGLEVPPGQPAINPGPCKMITAAIHDIIGSGNPQVGIDVEIFVPKGRELAEKTLNARLGILGGISILGTTGVVRPLSHDAFIATIESALSVARASGLTHAVLTTGRRSERFAQGRWPQISPEAFIQIGDFFKMSLEAAASKGFRRITLAVFFGKAVKMAQGIPHTHAAKAAIGLKQLARWAFDITGDNNLAELIVAANTARHAFDILQGSGPQVVHEVGERIVAAARGFAGRQLEIQSVIFDYSGNVFFDSGIRRHQDTRTPK
jgi:cobalt-precorrin-5B (C1)-methyltransferase